MGGRGDGFYEISFFPQGQSLCQLFFFANETTHPRNPGIREEELYYVLNEMIHAAPNYSTSVHYRRARRNHV